jgi:hypothetical protein
LVVLNRAGVATVAVVFAILATSSGSACNSVQAADCTNLVSAGAASRGDITKLALLFINGAASACTLRAPMISLIDDAGASLDIPQDWAPLANEQVLRLEAQHAAAVPFEITSLECAQTLRYAYSTAIFGGGVKARVPAAGELCPGSRIRVWAPVAAEMCTDGSFAWSSPNGSGSGCPRPSP